MGEANSKASPEEVCSHSESSNECWLFVSMNFPLILTVVCAHSGTDHSAPLRHVHLVAPHNASAPIMTSHWENPDFLSDQRNKIFSL